MTWSLLFGAATSLAAAEPLHTGDRIVFLGDSITQAGAGPGGYVTLVAEELKKRQPDHRVEVIGAGISGNRVPDLQRRLDRDVLARKPTLVVIYIGINDVWHWSNGKGTPKDAYESGLRDVIGRIQKAGARVLLCTPSVIGEKSDGSNPMDKMLEEYSAISRHVADDTKAQLVDLRKAFIEHLKQHNAANKERGLLTGDGVHLNAAGNRFVAERVLEALGVAGSGKVLRHVVLFKFKDSSSADQIAGVVAAFRALPRKIPQVKEFEWGTDVSPEGKAAGFTHCFLLTFATAADRDAYLPHPAHKEFVSIVGPHVDKVLVVDYWTEK